MSVGHGSLSVSMKLACFPRIFPLEGFLFLFTYRQFLFVFLLSRLCLTMFIFNTTQLFRIKTVGWALIQTHESSQLIRESAGCVGWAMTDGLCPFPSVAVSPLTNSFPACKDRGVSSAMTDRR